MGKLSRSSSADLGAIAQNIKSLMRTRYFPELWYLCEAWLHTVKGRRVLLVGYGLGLVGESLAKSGWSVTTVDSSVTALADLKRRWQGMQLQGAFEHGDLEKLPFDDKSFDAVVSLHTLEYARLPKQAVEEMARIVVSGGQGIVSSFNRFSPWGLSSVVQFARGGEVSSRAKFFNRREFEALLRGSPFVLEDTKEKGFYFPLTIAGLSMKSPVPGAFVGLLKK